MKKFFLISFLILYSNCFSQEVDDFFILGKEEMANQNFENAIELFSKAIINNQNISESYFARGLCYNLTKNYEMSTKDFSTSEFLGNKDIKLYTLRGFAYNQLNKNELALKDFIKAIKLNPDFYPKNYFNKAMIEIILKKNNDALLDLNEYIKREENPNAYYERAKLLYFQFKRKTEACHDIKSSINLGFENEYVKKMKELICD